MFLQGNYVNKMDFEPHPVMIPAEVFIPERTLRNSFFNYNSDLDFYNQAISYLGKCVGGTYEFSFTNRYEGNRVKMLREKELKYYFESSNPLKENVLVNSKIVNVNSRTLIVEVAGVETLIDINEIAPFRIPNLKTIYKAGEIINIVIINISKDLENERVVELEVSKKLADLQKYQRKLESIKIGEIYSGQIFSELNSGYLVWLDIGFTVYVKYRIPTYKLNDRVNIRITHIDPINIKLFGSYF